MIFRNLLSASVSCLIAFAPVVVVTAETGEKPDTRSSRRGDMTGDDSTDMKDAVAFLEYYFKGDECNRCETKADVTGDGRVDLQDALAILGIALVPDPPAPEPEDTLVSEGSWDHADDDISKILSPDIVYTQGAEDTIHIMRNNGLQKKSLGVSGARPAFSPDGKKIAFERYGDIYCMNVDGSGLQNLTNDGHATSDYEAAWAPDSQRIAFVRDHNLWTGTLGSNVFKQITYATNHDGWDSSPAWSPDGYFLAFVRTSTFAPYGKDIFVVNQHGQAFKQITNTPEIEEQPDWHPDGHGLVYSRRGSYGAEADLYVLFFDFVAVPFNVTQDPWNSDEHPSFSSDGSRIVFHSKSTAYTYGSNVYTIRLDGTFLRNLTGFIFDSLPSRARWPHWQRS